MKLLYVFLLAVFIIPEIDWWVYLDMFPHIREIAYCESRFDPKAYNPKDSDGRPKYGILQYGKKEFNSWSKKAGIKKPNIWDPMHQIITYRWAEENGLANRWGCWHQIIDSNLSYLFNL